MSQARLPTAPRAVLERAVCAALSDSADAVTAATPVDGCLKVASRGFEEMTGWPSASLCGTTCRALDVTCVAGTEEEMRLQAALVSGSPACVVLTRRRATGELFLDLVLLRGMPLGIDLSSGEWVWMLVGAHLDVTECGDEQDVQVEHEEAVRRIMGDVEAAIAEALTGLDSTCTS